MSNSSYDTFDSGGGPTIPEGEKSKFATRDSNLSAEGDAGQDKDLGVPQVPMTK